MFRSAVAVLFTSLVLAGCQTTVPATDKAGEDGTGASAVGTGVPATGTSESPAPATTSAGLPNAQSLTAAAPGGSSATTSGGTQQATAGATDLARNPSPSSLEPAAAASGGSNRVEPAAKAVPSSGGASVPALSAAGDAAAHVAPPPPAFKLVTVPAGTTLSVTLSNAVGSDTSNVEDSVRGKIATDVVIDGLTAIPAGSDISGTVTDAQQSGRVKGRATVAFRFDRLEVRDETSRIQTSSVAREAEADRGSDLKKGGIGAGIGAIVGGVAGGKKGAAIGAGVGGAGTVMATRGKEVRISAGSRVRVTLRDALEVRVPLG